MSKGKMMASDRCGSELRKGWCRDARKATLGFKQRGSRVRAKMKLIWPLKRATSRCSDATSRHSRRESSQRRDVGRRDVPESGKNQRRDVKISRHDVSEKGKTNVATLDSNVATFQRGSKPTLRRSRGVQNQRRDVPENGKNQHRDVETSRRDIPEKGQTDVATLRHHDVATSRRYREGPKCTLCNHGLR